MGGLFDQFVFAGSLDETSLDQRAVRSMAAVQMAINSINDKHDGIFDDLLPQTKVCCCAFLVLIHCIFHRILVHRWCIFVKLELLIGDTKGQDKNVMAEAFRHVQHGSVALLGAETSGQTITVSRWLSLSSIDLALVGHSATSSELSTSEFSNFLRTSPSDDIQAQTMLQLMKGLLVD